MTKRKPIDLRSKKEIEIDSAACMLHNLGGTMTRNTQGTDTEWFARWLYGASNFGMGDVRTMQWSLSNEEFELLGLTPDRQWTDKRWETMGDAERLAWIKLARLCLHALPHIAERIGDRFMEQSKGLRIVQKVNNGSWRKRIYE
jgi:hypothetical protein